MLDDNLLDMAADFEILYNPVENEKAMTAWMYQMEAMADHWSSYQE